MAYRAEISRHTPTAFLFLIDQSGSTSDKMLSGLTISEFVADVINRTLASLITKCTKLDETRDFFDIGIIGYGGQGVKNGFQGPLAAKIMHPISEIEASPLRIEDRVKKIPDGAGGIIEQNIKAPVWFDAEAYGGRPMVAALLNSAEVIAEWCDNHIDSFPPTIIHITSGEAYDGDPEEIGKEMLRFRTNDGNIIFFNCYICKNACLTLSFPQYEEELPDSFTKMLFRMSSLLPLYIKHRLQATHHYLWQIHQYLRPKCFMFNSDPFGVLDCVDLHLDTRPMMMK